MSVGRPAEHQTVMLGGKSSTGRLRPVAGDEERAVEKGRAVKPEGLV